MPVENSRNGAVDSIFYPCNPLMRDSDYNIGELNDPKGVGKTVAFIFETG